MIRRNAQCSRRGRRRFHLATGNPLKFRAWGLAGLWFSEKSVTLNGADASAIGDQSGSGRNLAQGTAGQQPLYTGAPIYNKWPSIQFTAASSDSLQLAATNVVGTGPVTLFGVWAVRGATAGVKAILGNTSVVGGIAAVVNNATLTRASYNQALAVHLDANMPASTAEVWALRQSQGGLPTLQVNGAAQSLSDATAGITDAGGGAALYIGGANGVGGIGNCDTDWLMGAVFTSVVTDLPMQRLNHAACAKYGLAG